MEPARERFKAAAPNRAAKVVALMAPAPERQAGVGAIFAKGVN